MQTLTELKVGPHPEKTYIARASRGFSFLRKTIALGGLRVSLLRRVVGSSAISRPVENVRPDFTNM